MRSECYQQSMVATGRAPVAVDPTQAPWSIIPPVFHASRNRGADDDLYIGDAAMSDSVSLVIFACVRRDLDDVCSKGALEGSRCSPSYQSDTLRTTPSNEMTV